MILLRWLLLSGWRRGRRGKGEALRAHGGPISDLEKTTKTNAILHAIITTVLKVAILVSTFFGDPRWLFRSEQRVARDLLGKKSDASDAAIGRKASEEKGNIVITRANDHEYLNCSQYLC